ncbi:MAG: hypothetical protein FOGNACKC_02201 [Anaerolineae bacterium]|nr:hypothetical protein [Anaerolineae bacterium]
MSYSITLSADGLYLILKVTGNINRRLAMKYNLEAHILGKESGVNRFLIDLTESRNVDSPVDTYEFAYKDLRSEPGINRAARIALLVHPCDHSYNFMEIVLRNSGLDVTLFADRELAERYLLAASRLEWVRKQRRSDHAFAM